MVGCKSKAEGPVKPALTHRDWNQDLAPSAMTSAAAAPGHPTMPQGHPEVAAHKPDKLDEAEQEAAEALAARAAQPAAAVSWNSSCQVHRKCAKAPTAIPDCEAGVIAEEWGQLQYNADKHVGQMVAVQGPLALTPARPPGSQKCAPGACCHALMMNIVLDGRPEAVALPGNTCTGDDSAMCCSMPANGQTVIARGKVQRASAASGLKFQLLNATFCIPKPPTEITDAGAPHM